MRSDPPTWSCPRLVAEHRGLLFLTGAALACVVVPWALANWRRARARAYGVGVHGQALARAVQAAVVRATEESALHPLTTTAHVVMDAGIPFVVSMKDVTEDAKKVQTTQRKKSQPVGLRDALAAIEEPLVISKSMFPHHTLALNKFPVVPKHTLLVTKEFESQLDHLSLDDWEAWWTIVARMQGVGFFNSGAKAGSSQPRKHMQVVPLSSLKEQHPLIAADDDPPATPLHAAIGQLAAAPSPGQPFTVPALSNASPPVLHAAAMLGDALLRVPNRNAAMQLRQLYLRLAAETGMDMSKAQPPAHNVVLTPTWMMVVPRCADRWEGLGANGIGFAGYLLISGVEDLARLRAMGPTALLGQLTGHAWSSR